MVVKLIREGAPYPLAQRVELREPQVKLLATVDLCYCNLRNSLLATHSQAP